MKEHKFAVGVIVGVGLVWAWHAWIRPLPGSKGA